MYTVSSILIKTGNNYLSREHTFIDVKLDIQVTVVRMMAEQSDTKEISTSNSERIRHALYQFTAIRIRVFVFVRRNAG
jgi:S-adenosylmethionine synthetase